MNFIDPLCKNIRQIKSIKHHVVGHISPLPSPLKWIVSDLFRSNVPAFMSILSANMSFIVPILSATLPVLEIKSVVGRNGPAVVNPPSPPFRAPSSLLNPINTAIAASEPPGRSVLYLFPCKTGLLPFVSPFGVQATGVGDVAEPSHPISFCGISEAAGRDGDLRMRSKSRYRARSSSYNAGFPNPDLFDRFAHSGRRLLTLPSYRFEAVRR